MGQTENLEINMERTEKFRKNGLKLTDCCAICDFFNPKTEICIQMKEQVVQYYTCKAFKRNGERNIEIIMQRLEDMCNHANYLEQHVVSLREYLKTGMTGYVGQRGLPSPENRILYMKNLIIGLPDILEECENMMGCLKQADMEVL